MCIRDRDYISELRNQYPLTKAEFDADGSYIRNFELRLWEHAKGRKKGGKNTHFYSNGIPVSYTHLDVYKRQMVYKEINPLLLQDIMKLI